MPHYSYTKTFTAGKSKTSEEELVCPCIWGIVTDVTITFPAGCHGYCHVHLDDGPHKMFPTNPESDYALDDWTLHIDDEYELEKDSTKIYLRGYNTGTYNHTITVTFRVKLPERYTPLEKALFKLIDIMQKLLGIA